MCFSPKISTQKPTVAPPEPAPLAEEVKAVDIGADSDNGEETKGISDLKVEKKTESPKTKDAVSRAMRGRGVNMG